MSEQVNIEEVDRAVGGAFGRPSLAGPAGVRSSAVEAFRDAGFCEADAERGVRLLESGDYLGFEDVALSMGTFDADFRSRNPLVTARRIRETAARLEGGATPGVVAGATRAAATFIDGRRISGAGS